MMKQLFKTVLQISLTIFLLLSFCEESFAGDRDRITVFAAASLTNAVEDIIKSFQEETGIGVDANLASSSILAKQILVGAMPGVYISANAEWMDEVEKSGLLYKDSRIDLLSNTLVIITPKDSTLKVDSWQDLVLPKVKSIALGDPGHVPAGMYAKDSMINLKIWDTVEKKIIPTPDVRAALAYVEMGEVDCALVYVTDALISRKVTVRGTMPVESHSKIVYPAAIVNGTGNVNGAWKFMEFLSSIKAKNIFERHGFKYLK